MSITPRRLCQVVLTTTPATLYTVPASTRTQITEIWLANNSATTRFVTLRAPANLANSNHLPRLEIVANGVQIVSNSKIVLTVAELLVAFQDTGNDVVLTAYGVEEVI